MVWPVFGIHNGIEFRIRLLGTTYSNRGKSGFTNWRWRNPCTNDGLNDILRNMNKNILKCLSEKANVRHEPIDALSVYASRIYFNLISGLDPFDCH